MKKIYSTIVISLFTLSSAQVTLSSAQAMPQGQSKMQQQAQCNVLAKAIADSACAALRGTCPLVQFTKGYYKQSQITAWRTCRDNVYGQFQATITRFQNNHPECSSIKFSVDASTSCYIDGPAS